MTTMPRREFQKTAAAMAAALAFSPRRVLAEAAAFQARAAVVHGTDLPRMEIRRIEA